MNINHDDIFGVYAVNNEDHGWPMSDESSSEEARSANSDSDSDVDDGDDPAPPYREDTVPRPFISWSSHLQNTGLGARSAAASSRVLPSEAGLGPLTRGGQYYSIGVLFKKPKVRTSYMYIFSSVANRHGCWRAPP